MPRKRALLILIGSTIVFIIIVSVVLRQEQSFNIVKDIKADASTSRPISTAGNDGVRLAASTSSPTSSTVSSVKSENDSLPLYVLLWTPFFGTQNYLPSTDEMKCEERRCVLTSDRKMIEKSKAVVFHFMDSHVGDVPSFRTPDQRWVIFNIESPLHSDFSAFDHLVNWTATYRLDSDLVTPYAHVRRLSPSEELAASDKLKKNYASSKSKMVAWFVSNCHTPSNRESFVQELQKTVAVDVYGYCGNFTCTPKMSKECYATVAQNYRFYLSFENSICKDYVTEKFFHILETDMIPVVMGGANYSRIAPPNSFIDALSFDSPKDLGEYLLKVARNETLYNSYFHWKGYYGLGGYHWVCAMCKKLHDPSEKSSVHHDLGRWWNDDSGCTSWKDSKKKPRRDDADNKL